MQAVNNGALLTSTQPSSNNSTTPYFPLQYNLPRNGVQNNGGPLGSSQAAALAAVAAASAAGLQTTMKDSRWLTLEVCRQNQRKMCSRDEKECKFAHPPPQVDVQNGRVTCCYDSIKGKCQRRDPPCKYFHPPQHLREQLLQNGRNNLIMKGMQLQFFQQQFLSQGAMLPLNSASSTSSVNGSPQCPPQPVSPVSSTSITSSGKFIYPSGPQLNLTAPNIASAYSLLGMNLSPYLNPITASQLNPMVAAALNAVKGGPVSNANAHTHISPLGPLCMMAVQPPVHSLAPFSLSSTLVAANGNATPAKRPAMTDAKNGLPIFDSSQPVATSTTNNDNTGLYSFQSSSTDTSGQKSILGADDVGENNKESDRGRQQQLQTQIPLQLQFYPETYMEVPQYSYP